MATIERVNSVGEAIQRALEGKASGEWNLFRGQSNAAWQVTSSRERASASDSSNADESFDQFCRFNAWAKSLSAMQVYFSRPDSLLAIAQHYGLKTPFIDFTEDPRIAAFFACDFHGRAEPDRQAAIICLNVADFEHFWALSFPVLTRGHKASKPPEIVRIDVTNLWRLQKQKGCFLWNPIYGIERFYDFDRIVFPLVSVDPALPPKNEVYPENQSALERHLTEFFLNENLREGNKNIRLENWEVFGFEVPESAYDAKSWWSPGIVPSADWDEADQWRQYPSEHADDVAPEIVIALSDDVTIYSAAAIIEEQLSSEVIRQFRAKTLSVRVKTPSTVTDDVQKLVNCTRRLWNGMRTLPFSNGEISVALNVALKLIAAALDGKQPDEVIGPDGMYVEMASRRDGAGAYSRGAITRGSLIHASNPQFIDAVCVHTSRPRTDLGIELLQLQGRPWERFTFSGLRKLMVEELIPTQVAWRAHRAGDEALRDVIYFSPTDFQIFGLA